MSALVRIAGDRAVADSRDVAADFGKQHKDVLRAIGSIIKRAPDLERNFAPKVYNVATGDGGKRAARCFELDRKGFMLLVMGFSGAKALDIKSRWIDAFDAMELRLLGAQVAINDDPPASPAPPQLAEDILPAITVVREARQVFGRAAARQLWRSLGLPMPDMPKSLIQCAASGDTAPPGMGCNAEDWIAECCVADPSARTGAAELYRSYVTWCAEQQNVPETQSSFGRALSRGGILGAKDGNGRVYRRGIRLIQ